MTRQYQYAESPGTSTQTSGTEITKVRLRFTGTVGDVYLVFMNCSAGTTNGAKFSIYPNDGSLLGIAIDPVASNDMQSCPMYYFVTLGSGANNFDQALVLFSNVGTITVREASIFALKVDALDAVDDLGGSNTSSATYATIKSHSFDVATDGDYLIFCNGAFGNADISATMNVRFNVPTKDATNYSDMQFVTVDADTNYVTPYLGMVKLTLAAGTHTIVMEAKTSAGTLVIPEWCSIIALRADTFPNAYYAESRASATSTTAYPTYTTKATLTQTTNNKSHAAFSASMAFRAAAGRLSYQRTRLDAATTLQENVNQTIVANSESIHSALSMSTLSAASHSWTVEAAKDGVGASTISEMAVAVLELPTPPVLNILGGNIKGGNLL